MRPLRQRAQDKSDGRAAILVAVTGVEVVVTESSPPSAPSSPEPNHTNEAQQGCLPLILRIFWLMAGNVALFMVAGFIAKGRSPGTMDAVFVGLVLSLLLARYVDIKVFKGETSDGAPATMADFSRYALLLIAGSAVAYAVARFVLLGRI